jgi:hypothetical protein
MDFDERDFRISLSVKAETDSLYEIVITNEINRIIVE